MPRLIILLFIALVMAAVAVQNPTSLSLVVLGGSRTPDIPLGLMLVGAVALGSLTTLVLYGLVGLRRPPESKYRPMGQRVPYPNSPGSTTLPPSGPAYQPEEKPYSSPSTAFVSEPTVPQDSASVSSPTESGSQVAEPYSAPYQSESTYQGESANVPYDRAFSSPEVSTSDVVEPMAESAASPEPRPAIRNPFAQKKKDKSKREDPIEDKKVGDNWGDLRTAEQLNSWEAIGESARSPNQEAGKKSGFFDSIATGIGLGSGTPQAAGQMADDIAAGWDANSPRPDGYGSDGYIDGYDSDGHDDRYGDELDRGWENFDSYEGSPSVEGPQARPQKRVYNDGLYGDGAEGPYLEADSPEETGPDGVYEADYRVIEPPSKPLDDTSVGNAENDDDYYPS